MLLKVGRPHGEVEHGHAGVLSHGHGRGAGVVLLAGEVDLHRPDPHDGVHDPDPSPLGLQVRHAHLAEPFAAFVQRRPGVAGPETVLFPRRSGAFADPW